MTYWIYLLLASLFEIGWMYSLKLTDGFSKTYPLISYAICGFFAAFFLSKAMTRFSMSFAYAIWMGLAIAGGALIEFIWLKSSFDLKRIFFTGLILAGIIGLKFTSLK